MGAGPAVAKKKRTPHILINQFCKSGDTSRLMQISQCESGGPFKRPLA